MSSFSILFLELDCNLQKKKHCVQTDIQRGVSQALWEIF